MAGPVTAILAVQCPKAELSRCPALNPRQKSYMEVRGYRIWHELGATQKGNFCVTLDSKILMYDSTLRFSHLRKP